MTWILPKQLHTLACALDTEALSLDLNESSQICEQSLFVRSKRLPLRTWLQKWKRDSWTQHLSGRILKLSLGNRFADAWTSSLGAIPASPSVQQASERGKMTQDIYGLGLQMELIQCDQVSVSLKMSKDISRWGCPTPSKTWEEWVTEQRGAYSARLKLALLTNGNGSSSWPTATTRDWKDGTAQSCQNVPMNGLLGRVVHQSPNIHGNRPESWATPRSGKVTDENQETWALRQAKGDVATMPLTLQAKLWRTPSVAEEKNQAHSQQIYLQNQVGATPKLGETSGKLNPRWVETLMGLPVGWTMPSCACPVTIALTNSDSSETA
jgi:hypothetical protein